MEVLAVLEGYATALAAPNVRKQDVRVLRQHVSAMQRAMRGWEMQPFDESLLDRVRALPPRYRALAS